MKKAMILIFALFTLVSCATKTEVIYKMPTLDLEPSMQILFDSRPKNEEYPIKTDIKTTFDIVDNSVSYANAWEDWEAYSVMLESYIQAMATNLIEIQAP